LNLERRIALTGFRAGAGFLHCNSMVADPLHMGTNAVVRALPNNLRQPQTLPPVTSNADG